MPFVECPVCEGHGTVIISNSTFSMSAEQWYPVEHEDRCDECDNGMVWREGDDD